MMLTHPSTKPLDKDGIGEFYCLMDASPVQAAPLSLLSLELNGFKSLHRYCIRRGSRSFEGGPGATNLGATVWCATGSMLWSIPHLLSIFRCSESCPSSSHNVASPLEAFVLVLAKML